MDFANEIVENCAGILSQNGCNVLGKFGKLNLEFFMGRVVRTTVCMSMRQSKIACYVYGICFCLVGISFSLIEGATYHGQIGLCLHVS